MTVEQREAIGGTSAPTNNHTRWHVKRGIVNLNCVLYLPTLPNIVAVVANPVQVIADE
jgi:hypothetical protein